MIGHIESYDIDTQTGIIKCNEQFFAFHIDDWIPIVPPEQGDDVNFEIQDKNAAIKVNLVGAYLEAPKAVKYKYLAGALGIIFGFAGLHRLYLGYYKIAIAQLILTVITHGYGVLWGFIDAILILGGQINKDGKGRPLK